uniref:NADH-ubiquinone oxidoreductase chain 3 n=1 Tax=Mileewa sharpa TaxID=2984023 RepID=A0A977TM22_9HEMI|nr:NADH dehydrogenase subunit 3 [Mileewa sharpa]UXX17559.1 NADH dehydrogenase subunit 3 [Mileewa sharpa]
MLTMIHMMVILLITVFLMMLINFISKKTMIDMQKSSPFECGFNPVSNKRLPFSIHFFLTAVIFLIFDIEIIIIMPMIMTIKSTILINWVLTSCLFVLVLIMGLYHEWLNGMLNWTK